MAFGNTVEVPGGVKLTPRWRDVKGLGWTAKWKASWTAADFGVCLLVNGLEGEEDAVKATVNFPPNPPRHDYVAVITGDPVGASGG